MTLEEFAARVPGARRHRAGFLAPGICHGGRKLKLAIDLGKSGNIVVRCWSRGCSAEDIVHAIGLQLSDLFTTPRPNPAESYGELRWAFRRAPVATIDAALRREVELEREARLRARPYDTPRVRASDVNAARKRVNAIFETTLRAIEPFYWETCPPNDQDPLWPLCLDRAVEEIAFDQDVAWFQRHWTRFPRLRVIVEDRAATLLHQYARAHKCECAA